MGDVGLLMRKIYLAQISFLILIFLTFGSFPSGAWGEQNGQLAERASSLGAGFSTIQNAVPGNVPAFTITYDLASTDLLQGFFSIPQTNFLNLGGALFYKHTLTQSRGAGFHIGAGAGLGILNTGLGGTFSMSLTALGGFHFQLPGIPHIIVHLDGGPNFTVLNTNPIATQTNFQFGGLSPALGASILYLF